MTYFKITFSILLVFALASCNNKSQSKNKFGNPELIRIYEMTDHRNGAGLVEYFASPDAKLREEATMAFGSIQDTTFAKKIHPLLTDSDVNVRVAAAYALGQIGNINSIDPLMDAYVLEMDELVRGNILESLGKITASNITNGGDMDKTIQAMGFLDAIRFDNEGDRLGWAKGVLWINMSGFTNEKLMDRMPYVLQKTGGDSRIACAVAMARFKGEWFKQEKNKKYVISWCKTERTSEVRIAQIAMLAKINDQDSKDVLLGYLKSDSQEQRVKVSALRSASRMESILAADIIHFLSDSDDAVVIECLSALEKKDVKKELSIIAEKCAGRIAQIKSAAMRLQKKNGMENLDNMIWDEFQNAQVSQKVHFAHALGVCPPKAEDVLNAIGIEKEFSVKYAMTESLIEMHQDKAWPSDVDYFQSAMMLFRQGDIGVQALIALDFRDKKFNDNNKSQLNSAFEETLPKLVLPKEIETYNEIIRTLNSIDSQKRAEKKSEFNHPLDWNIIAGISFDQKALVTTNKGNFTIQLHVNDAPGSVANFVTLARSGFFDNKYFHRVIPNFVAQGGCPRGDGMGGTDYTIRSEFRLHDYSTGAVGLASSGKDTESCQWFVSLMSTPHLEGHYTIFGNVTKGMEVVNQILIGDQILKIEIVD